MRKKGKQLVKGEIDQGFYFIKELLNRDSAEVCEHESTKCETPRNWGN